MDLSESVLRDYLSTRLHIIEPGLILLKVEYALANKSGSGGFVDILARSRFGELVVIELKRSDQTARQALHELEKYVALLAANRGIRLDQVRCLLVSTTWRELLTPFGRFARRADYQADGLRLLTDDNGIPVGVEPVVLPKSDEGLELCPVYVVLLYRTAEARDCGRTALIQALSALGVIDFAIVRLDYFGSSERVIYPYAICVALAQIAVEDQTAFRSPNADTTDSEPDAESWWYEQEILSETLGRVRPDDAESGSPDRLKAMRDWERSGVEGFGRYSDDLVWSEADLLSEIEAVAGRYSASYGKSLKVGGGPIWHRMAMDLKLCLEGSGEWPAIVEAILAEAETLTEAELTVQAFCPNDVLSGLEHLVRTNGDRSGLPELQLAYKSVERSRLYYGVLLWDGVTRPADLESTLQPVVGGSLLDYAMWRAGGALWVVDSEIAALHGLRYFVMEFSPGDASTPVYRLGVTEDGKLLRYKHDDESKDYLPWSAFVDSNSNYLRKIVRAFDQIRF